MNMAKTLLSKTLSDACPVCNAQYESHSALLKKIQSNGSIEAALQSLLTSRADLEKRIIQIGDFLDRGHNYLASLKSNAITNINERLLNADSEATRLSRELADTKHELAVKTENLHKLRARVRNLNKDSYITFINNAISSVKATIAKIDNSHEELLTSIKSASDVTVKIASNRAEALTKLQAAEQNDTYLIYNALKIKYILPEGEVLDLLSPIYNELAEAQISLHEEIAATTEAITKLQNTLAHPGDYSSEPLLLEKLFSLTEELRQIEDATTRIEALLSPLVDDFSAPVESLLNELQLKKSELDKSASTTSSSLMLTNIVQAQIENVLPFFKYRELRAEIDSHRDTKNRIENLSISLDRELKKIELKLKERIDNFFYTDLITSIYRKVDPHPFFKTVRFECIFPIEDKPRLEVYLYEDELSQPISPALYFSSAQLNILSLSIFLAKALHIEHDGDPVRAILIDDPIHSMDSINVLSVIDLLRNISIKFDRQIILSTHDENFYELLKLKVPEEQFGSKFIKFRSFGVVHADGNTD
jgi:exonuclease SbcC